MIEKIKTSVAEVVNQPRWKSWVIWTSIAGQIVALLILTGTIEPSQADIINNVIAGVLQLLVTFGILNNGTSKNTF